MFSAKKSENTISISSYPWFSHVTELNNFARELCLDYKISWCPLYSIPPYLIVDHPLLWEWQIEVISRIYIQKSYSETSGIFVIATIDLFLSLSLQIEGGQQLIKNGDVLFVLYRYLDLGSWSFIPPKLQNISFFPSGYFPFGRFTIFTILFYFYARFHQFPTARTSKHPFFSDSPRKPPTETPQRERQRGETLRHSTYYLLTTSHVRNTFIDSIGKGII